MLNDNLFSQTWNQIVDGALKDALKSPFQMFGSPRSWTWPTAPIGQQSAQAYQAVSVMPARSPVGSYGPLDADLFSAYKTALSHVQFQTSPEIQRATANLRNQIIADENAVAVASSNVNAGYQAESANGGAVFKAKYPSLEVWLEGPSGKARFTVYERAAEALKYDSQTLLTMQQAFMPSTLKDAIAVTQLPTGDPADIAPRGWTKVPDGSGVLRWQPDWTIGTTGTDWRAELTAGSVGQFDVNLSANDSTVNFSKSWASGSTSYSSWFWSVHANGSWSQMNLTAEDKSVTAKISVKSSTLVPVTPGSWYDGGFLRELALGSSGSGGWTIAPPWVASGGKSSLFGEHGLMPARVNGLVVVYQPSFSVTMSKSTFQQNQSRFEASGGFKIGPFSIGGEGGHSSSYQHSASGGTTFTAESTSTDPVLIGVTVAFPGVESDKPS